MTLTWKTALRQALLAWAMALGAGHAWAAQVVEYNFRAIIVADKAAADQVQQKLDAGADFGRLAFERSIDRKTGEIGGLMRQARAHSLNRAIAAELQRLKPGERSAEPRMSDFGWFVLKLDTVTMVEGGSGAGERSDDDEDDDG